MALVQELIVCCYDLDWHQFHVILSFRLLLESKSTFAGDSASFLQEPDFLSETSFHSFVSLLKSLFLLRLF